MGQEKEEEEAEGQQSRMCLQIGFMLKQKVESMQHT